MNHKVLLADDSLTIQKVIKITLANQPFEITDCSTDENLFKLLPQVKPEIVFLDFNLSEKYSGYELCSKIKEILPSTQVLFLLGTFDVVDDGAMEKCGAADKIVKPFDSNKFISICKRLVDTAPVEEIIFPTPQKTKLPETGPNEGWTVNQSGLLSDVPADSIKENQKPFNVREHLNPLDQEVSDWGMSIPGVIHQDQAENKVIDLPPVIGIEKTKKPQVQISDKSTSKDEIKFPNQDDLDFPDIDMSARPQAQPQVHVAPEVATKPVKKEPELPRSVMAETSEAVALPSQDDLDFPDMGEISSKTEPQTSSKLISIETFHNVQDKTGEFEIEHSINSMVETDISSIQAQIRDEVEEDLWHVDEFESVKEAVAEKIEELKNAPLESQEKFNEDFFKPLDSGEELEWNVNAPQVSPVIEPAPIAQTLNQSAAMVQPEMINKLRDEMAALIKTEVKAYMDQMFKDQVEKVSWEVIPDLAENLIKSEISKISNKILNDSN